MEIGIRDFATILADIEEGKRLRNEVMIWKHACDWANQCIIERNATIENQERKLALLWAEHEAWALVRDGARGTARDEAWERHLDVEAAHDAVEAMKEEAR